MRNKTNAVSRYTGEYDLFDPILLKHFRNSTDTVTFLENASMNNSIMKQQTGYKRTQGEIVLAPLLDQVQCTHL